MKDTGVIKEYIDERLGKLVYTENGNKDIYDELVYSVQADKAHIIMLYESKIINKEVTEKILKAIVDLEKVDYEPLKYKYMPRGIFLYYEDYLINLIGEEAGGILQTGRSRNDLKVAVLLLKLRESYTEILDKLILLQKKLMEKAEEYSDYIMPAYTHFRAAVPITFGHYLLGISTAIDRDIRYILKLKEILQVCPLGAAAVGGTSFPINQKITAELLGFDDYTLNSIDTVASRDIITRLLSNIAISETTMSRFSSDLLLWATNEFGFFYLPDDVVGSSSIMPNKRNPFLLENIQGSTTSAEGALISSLGAMHNTPFSNAVSVGTVSVGYVWKALKDYIRIIDILTVFIDKIEPKKEVMYSAAVSGYTIATELANTLVRECDDISFRKAHHIIGDLVLKSERDKKDLFTVFEQWAKDNSIKLKCGKIDPKLVVENSIYGGGPGLDSFKQAINKLKESHKENINCENELKDKWNKAKVRLDKKINDIVEE